MQISTFLAASAAVVVVVNANPYPGEAVENVVQLAGQHEGRVCDSGRKKYVSWSDTKSAISKWCSAHEGKSVPKGGKVDDGPVGGYRSGVALVELYVKYQNDHAEEWIIEEESCNWYMLYIAQGCTPGGDKPSDPGRLFTDGGTFYEPNMGSIMMRWEDQD
ncbi:MAG: hypothetical protein M1817_006920 [Caeruleum heppii]|nr:MAG: hypothetical protein M1817_006920 [Caeruleum heppii]